MATDRYSGWSIYTPDSPTPAYPYPKQVSTFHNARFNDYKTRAQRTCNIHINRLWYHVWGTVADNHMFNRPVWRVKKTKKEA